MGEEYITGIDEDYARYVKTFNERTRILEGLARQPGCTKQTDNEIGRLVDAVRDGSEFAGKRSMTCVLFNRLAARLKPDGEPPYVEGSRYTKWNMLSKKGWLNVFKVRLLNLADEILKTFDLDETMKFICPVLTIPMNDIKTLVSLDRELTDDLYRQFKFVYVLVQDILTARTCLENLVFLSSRDGRLCSLADEIAKTMGLEALRKPAI